MCNKNELNIETKVWGVICNCGEARVKKKRTYADIGGGGVKQEWTPSAHIWFKI